VGFRNSFASQIETEVEQCFKIVQEQFLRSMYHVFDLKSIEIVKVKTKRFKLVYDSCSYLEIIFKSLLRD